MATYSVKGILFGFLLLALRETTTYATLVLQRDKCTQTSLHPTGLNNISSEYCVALEFPEYIISVTEIECGVFYGINISWNGVGEVSTISWCGDKNKEVIYNISGDPQLVNFQYFERVIQISVTLTYFNCSKTTLAHYFVERVLTSVSLVSQKLVITSRPCIPDQENYEYKIISTALSGSSTIDLGSVSFNPTMKIDMDLPNGAYQISVNLVEKNRNITIDQKNISIHMYSSLSDGNTCQTDPVIIGVGVAGGLLGGVLIGTVATIFLMVSISRKKRVFETVTGTGYSCTGDVSTAVRALYQSKTSSVVYDTVMRNKTSSVRDSSHDLDNNSPQTTPNPAYGELQ